jgi:hypothetical protein
LTKRIPIPQVAPNTTYEVELAYRDKNGILSAFSPVGTGVTDMSVDFSTVSGATKPADNATVGARVGSNLFPGTGSTPLPGSEVLNSLISIDAFGRLINTGAGSVVVDNSKIALTDGALPSLNTLATNTNSEVVAARSGFANLNARISSISAGAADWNTLLNKPLTLAALDAAASTTLYSVRDEVVAARGSYGTFGARIGAEETARASETGSLAGRASLLETVSRSGVNISASPLTWTTNDQGTETAVGDATVNSDRSVTVSENIIAGPKKLWEVQVGRVYEVVADIEVTNTGDGSLNRRILATSHTDAGVATSGSPWASVQGPNVTANGRATIVGRFSTASGSGIVQFADNATAKRVRFTAGIINSTNGSCKVYSLSVRDITSQVDAEARISTVETTNTTQDASIASVTNEVVAARSGELTLNARFGSVVTAYTNADTALAGRATALESTVNNGTTGVAATAARLTTEEGTRATADSALAGRATTLEAQMANTSGSGLQSRISTEETVRASADTALASRATVLESVASSGSPGANLVPNSALTSLDGYELVSSGTGPFLRGLNLSNPTWGTSTNPTGYLNVSRTGVGSDTVMDERSPRFRLRPNERYGFAARLAPHRATASVRLEFLDASGAFLSNTSLTTGGTEGGASAGNPANFTTVGAFGTAPSNAAFGRVVVRLAGNGQNDPYVFWQAMDCFQASEGQTVLRPHQDGPPLDRTADLVTATARIATEETTRASADSALAARATTLETTVNDGTTGLVTTRARLITEESTRASADAALATRATTLEAQMGNTSGSGLQSRISTEESARASADAALATRATTLEAQMANTSGSGLQSRISTEESVRASADSTLAFRSTTLESSFRFPVPEAINKNPTFATWSGASGTLPEDWSDWSFGTTNTKATGDLSPNAYRQSNPAGAVNYGLVQFLDGRMTQGNYVLEAEVTLNSGVFNGAGLYCQWGVSSITVDERIEFTTALDVSGSVPGAGVVGRRYRFSKMIFVSNTAELFRLFLMTSHTGFATSGNAKDLTWHKALIRPATQGEIDAKVAKDTTIPTTIARIATEETTRATADSALAARATTLEATVNDGTTGLVATRARLITEEGTRATADSALASRSTTLEAQMANTAGSGLQSRISTEESTRASADSAQASQITTLSARVDGRPNLFPYPQPISNVTPTAQGWLGNPIGALYSGNLGGMVYYRARAGGSATTEVYYYDLPDTFYSDANNQYTVAASGYAGGSSNTVGDRLYMYIEFRSADNSTLLHNTPGIHLNSSTTRYTQTTNYTGGGVSGRLRVVFVREFAASGSYQDVVFSNIKLEAGTIATAFTNTAQVQVSAQAIATLNSSAAFWQVLVAASGGDPAIVRLFSGLGGSEVAIAAKIISLVNTSSGVAMPVMRATGGEAFFQRPISSDFGSRRVTIGPGYGVSGSEVVLWFGPSTIAPASQSRTNCIFALGTDGIVYYGGTNLEVGGMQGTLNLYNVNLTRSGTGATAQSMTATGFAPGTISYLWELVSGDAVNIGSTTSATTNIGHSLTLGQTKTSVVKCTMTSSAGPSTFRLLNISSSELS